MEMFLTLPPWGLWFIAGIFLIIVEIFTPGFVICLIGAACLISGVSAVFTGNLIIQFGIFSISAILIMIFIRPIMLKYFSSKTKRSSNVDALIGREVLVTENIDNLKETGYIKIGADYFRARSENKTAINKGAIVIIKKIEGITATVSLKK